MSQLSHKAVWLPSEAAGLGPGSQQNLVVCDDGAGLC